MKVSLKEGVATIQFAPANRVTLAKIRNAIRSNGFQAREAEINVVGSLAGRGDTLTLVVPGIDDPFILQDAPGAAGVVAELRRRDRGVRVLLAGQVPATKTRGPRGSERLLVRSFSFVGGA